MADEIIKLIEYLAGHPLVQGMAIAYVILVALVAVIVVTMFIVTLRTIFKWR